MRPSRLLATLAAAAAGLLCLAAPAGATPAPAPLGGGSVLFNPFGPAENHCTVAFAATDASAGYVIAGPGCSGGTLYSGDNVVVGEAVAAPGHQGGHLVVRVTNTTDWELVPWISTGTGRVTVAGSKETPVGGAVCLAGPVVGLRCGTVLAKNQTVTFPWGTLSGLTRTDVCAYPADDSGAFVTDDQAQGVPIGGSGACTATGTSFFEPINPILSAYGLRLLTG